MRLPDGRFVVADNRWDTAPPSAELPNVGVVVPYYDQPRQLALVLEALATQAYPAEKLHVVVADDGSQEPPDIAPWIARLTVSVVRQDDLGFRAAAARNLGAAAVSGSILCFLDADTVPAPDYIANSVSLPAAVPDAIVVGRRKHADLSGVTVSDIARWSAESVESLDSVEKGADGSATEPQWLVDAYERTADLRDPGWNGYKYVLSAVLTCSRELFDAVGGFDESFVRYGGEDWEFANRAFMMGAVLAHQPKALAWHDGPDWGGRAVDDRTTEKNDEAMALAPLVTDPAARGAGLHHRIPDIVALVSTRGHSAASLLTTVSSFLRGTDCAVWLDDDSLLPAGAMFDSRIRFGRPDSSILSRCRFVVEVSGRVIASSDSAVLLVDHVGPGRAGEVHVDFECGVEESGIGNTPSVTMWTSRALHRSRRWARRLDVPEKDLRVALFGRHTCRASEVGLTVSVDEPWLSW